MACNRKKTVRSTFEQPQNISFVRELVKNHEGPQDTRHYHSMRLCTTPSTNFTTNLNFTPEVKFANFNELYNGKERTEQLLSISRLRKVDYIKGKGWGDAIIEHSFINQSIS